MVIRLFTFALAVTLAAGAGNLALAQESGQSETDARMQALEQRVLQLEKALAEARGESPPPVTGEAVAADKGAAAQPTAVEEVGGGTVGAYDYDKSMFGPIAPLSTKDGRFKTFLFGHLQVDAAAYSQEPAITRITGRSDFSGGAKMRRVSFGLASIVEDDWIVFMSYALADGGEQVDSGLRAAAIVYRGIKPWWLMAGQFGNSVGLESSTFNQYTSMVERPMISNAFVYAPGAPLMAVIAAHRGKLTYARAGIFGKHTKVDSEYDEGWGLHGRFLLQPHKERRLSSQIGVSGYWRKPEVETIAKPEDYDDYVAWCPAEERGNSVRFNAFGSSAVDGTSLVDTGKFCDVEDYAYVAAEGAYSQGPFSVQGEWGTARVNTKNEGNFEFSGGYVDVGYFLTGESRNYNPYFGQFWRIKPNNDLGSGGFGAIELRARWQTIDLNDRIPIASSKPGVGPGGEANGFTFGVHWYVNAFTRAMFNAGRINVERPIWDGGQYRTYEGAVDEYVARLEMSF